MEKTHREIATFLQAAAPWLEKNPAESKFRYAVKKVLKACTTIWEHYTEKVTDASIEHCAVDKDGVILKDARGELTFTRDGLRKRNAIQKVLFDTTATLEPFIAKDAPKDLTDAERDAFAGFVLTDAEPEDAP